MTDRVKILLEQLKSKSYRQNRKSIAPLEFDYSGDYKAYVNNFAKMCDAEKPVLFEADRIGFNRTADTRTVWGNGNITPNYARIIGGGFDEVINSLKQSMSQTTDNKKLEFGNAALQCIQLVYGVCDGYKAYAKEHGNSELYNALCNIPQKGAKDLYEALVFMKIIVFTLRNCGHTHITFGRFDKYLYPYYKTSKNNGATDKELLELIEEFFISINFDTDLYCGIQQGDNGQSMVLGGYDEDGKDMYNELSDLCMDASLELSLIDPKINLRVSKNTPDERLVKATHLTKAGLGFPQYCNDDVVVPGLIKLGYDKKDAFDYTVAACWEYIAPNNGADIPNISTLDFPAVVNFAVMQKLYDCAEFSDLMKMVKVRIARECDIIVDEKLDYNERHSPYMSLFLDGCAESLTDCFHGGTKYYNYGCHGAGISNAADALAAIKKTVYEDKSISKDELIEALKNNFSGMSEIRNTLLSCPKMGNNDDYVDDIAKELMDAFTENLNGKPNGHGGIWRAGTGSAMEYVRLGERCPATADGREAYTPYPSSFSPSLVARTNGLLSCMLSFTKYDMTNIINGGPVSVEIHDSVLKNDIGIEKTAMLVKEFIHLGGHQLQLNSVNRDRLLDAQKHPENYPNLIVRVWGWSGYFNELDVKYQNHIISRCEYLG